MGIRKKRPVGKAPYGRRLVRRVYAELWEQGFTKKQIAQAVETVIASWKRALARGESVEVPLGHLDVVKSRREIRSYIVPPGSENAIISRRFRYPKRVQFRKDKKELN